MKKILFAYRGPGDQCCLYPSFDQAGVEQLITWMLDGLGPFRESQAKLVALGAEAVGPLVRRLETETAAGRLSHVLTMPLDKIKPEGRSALALLAYREGYLGRLARTTLTQTWNGDEAEARLLSERFYEELTHRLESPDNNLGTQTGVFGNITELASKLYRTLGPVASDLLAPLVKPLESMKSERSEVTDFADRTHRILQSLARSVRDPAIGLTAPAKTASPTVRSYLDDLINRNLIPYKGPIAGLALGIASAEKRRLDDTRYLAELDKMLNRRISHKRYGEAIEMVAHISRNSDSDEARAVLRRQVRRTDLKAKPQREAIHACLIAEVEEVLPALKEQARRGEDIGHYALKQFLERFPDQELVDLVGQQVVAEPFTSQFSQLLFLEEFGGLRAVPYALALIAHPELGYSKESHRENRGQSIGILHNATGMDDGLRAQATAVLAAEMARRKPSSMIFCLQAITEVGDGSATDGVIRALSLYATSLAKRGPTTRPGAAVLAPVAFQGLQYLIRHRGRQDSEVVAMFDRFGEPDVVAALPADEFAAIERLRQGDA